MKRIGIILLLFLTISFTKNDNLKESTDFIYSVKLYPSFAAKSEIEITKSGNSGKIKLTILKDAYFPETFKDSTVLSEADLKYFSDSLSDVSLSEIKNSDSQGMDGMNFVNVYRQNGKSNEFQFWSPKKDSKYYKIADAVIGLLKRKLTQDSENKYFGKLERHYKM